MSGCVNTDLSEVRKKAGWISRQRKQQCKDLIEVGSQCGKNRVRWKMVGDGETGAWEVTGMGQTTLALISHSKDFGFYTE